VKRYLESGAQPVYSRKRMPSKLDSFKPLIDQWLAAQPALLATRVHQDLARDYGFEGSYNTVRRYVERSRPKPPARSEARFETRPGFQAQVDWSHEQPIRTSSGLELPLYCFHMVLGHSRDSFCRLTGSQDLVTFWACHRAAFTHFGGVPHELLYDRTKTVVRQHVGKDVTLEERIFHPEALASAHHYGFSMRLCQAYRAKTKGKVEHDVSWVRERLFRGHSFTSYEEANVGWLSWNEDIARQRVHGTHGEVVAVRAQRDHAALLPLQPTAYLVVDRTTGSSVSRAAATTFRTRSPASGSSLYWARPSSRCTRCWMAGGSRGMSAAAQPGCCPIRSRTRCRSPRSSRPSQIRRSITGRLSAIRRRSLGELISERIRRNARELKLYGLAETADELVDRAEAGKLGYREFLDLVLESEVGVLEGRRYASRLKLSGLPHHKTLDEFDASFQPELDPKRLAELRSLRFVQNKVSSLILGPPGVGKTHLAVGLAMQALRAGYLVRYTTLDEVVRELRQADQLGTLRSKLAHYQRPHVLIVDEVGYMRLEPADANRFFQLIKRRYTRSSMIVTSNKRVSEWAELFGDEVQAVAILDRLLHDAEVLTINGPSWRLRGRGDLLSAKPQTAEDSEISPTDTPRQPRRGPQKGSHEAD
jgi:DNA replication protein DnaC/transposase